MAADRSMPPVPSVSVLVPIDTAPVGLVTCRPRIDVLVVSVVARFAVEVASNRAVSAEVGPTPSAQLPVVPHPVLMLPVQVRVAAVAAWLVTAATITAAMSDRSAR